MKKSEGKFSFFPQAKKRRPKNFSRKKFENFLFHHLKKKTKWLKNKKDGLEKKLKKLKKKPVEKSQKCKKKLQ